MSPVKIKPYPRLVWNYCLDSRFSRRIQRSYRVRQAPLRNTELRIKQWTGVCYTTNSKILGLGNDFYQIGVGLLDAVGREASRLSVSEADRRRFHDHGVEGRRNAMREGCQQWKGEEELADDDGRTRVEKVQVSEETTSRQQR